MSQTLDVLFYDKARERFHNWTDSKLELDKQFYAVYVDPFISRSALTRIIRTWAIGRNYKVYTHCSIPEFSDKRNISSDKDVLHLVWIPAEGWQYFNSIKELAIEKFDCKKIIFLPICDAMSQKVHTNSIKQGVFDICTSVCTDEKSPDIIQNSESDMYLRLLYNYRLSRVIDLEELAKSCVILDPKYSDSELIMFSFYPYTPRIHDDVEPNPLLLGNHHPTYIAIVSKKYSEIGDEPSEVYIKEYDDNLILLYKYTYHGYRYIPDEHCKIQRARISNRKACFYSENDETDTVLNYRYVTMTGFKEKYHEKPDIKTVREELEKCSSKDINTDEITDNFIESYKIKMKGTKIEAAVSGILKDILKVYRYKKAIILDVNLSHISLNMTDVLHCFDRTLNDLRSYNKRIHPGIVFIKFPEDIQNLKDTISSMGKIRSKINFIIIPVMYYSESGEKPECLNTVSELLFCNNIPYLNPIDFSYYISD